MKTTNPRSSDGSPCDCARVAEDPGIASAYGFPRPAVQQVPLFYTVGVSARGLFDARPRDDVGFGIAAGYFSNELQRAQRDGLLFGPNGGIQDHETVMELTYRFDRHKSALFVQPDFQYIIRAGGTGHLKNAPVFGAQFGINS